MSDFQIHPIPARATRDLRQRVLRPHQKPADLVYPGDDAPDSLHVGAFLDEQLVGIASVSRESHPTEPNTLGWRLRGMAVVPELHQRGVGRALVRACIAHVASRGGVVLWCNGRTTATAFYHALGFEPIGAEFDVPFTGPHFVFRRAILVNDQDPKE